MRLAYVSYEYPPDTAFGGIGTYVYITRAMRRMGYEVEVFSAGTSRESLHEIFEEGIIVHRVHCAKRKQFPSAIAPVFAARHQQQAFDLIESPEFDADGRVIREQFPHLPMAVKFHTPKFLVRELNNSVKKPGWLKRLFTGSYKKMDDAEYRLALAADDLSAPSLSLRSIIAERWEIDKSLIRHHPYIFLPNETFLRIPVTTLSRTVTFTGRLETRKGVLALAQAIPEVLQKHPDVTFRFIGKPDPGPNGQPMDVYLKAKLAPFAANIRFIPRVPPDQIPLLLAETDICVYPSLWENFPNVCLEAMSAARGIVASRNGGMEDMLEDIKGGILIDPKKPGEIAKGICYLLENPEERQAMGQRCRDKILTYYAGSLLKETAETYREIAGIK